MTTARVTAELCRASWKPLAGIPVASHTESMAPFDRSDYIPVPEITKAGQRRGLVVWAAGVRRPSSTSLTTLAKFGPRVVASDSICSGWCSRASWASRKATAAGFCSIP